MELRFPQSEICRLSACYEDEMSERDRRLTETLIGNVFPSYALRGFLTKDQFLTVCSWKTPRPKPRCESNEASLIQEVSTIAMTTESEQMRIQIWTLLAGVKWPTASVFLHFAFPDRYPILDFRALWSLKIEVPAQYSFPFWLAYTDFCFGLAKNAGVSMRNLDQALWKYSEINQRK